MKHLNILVLLRPRLLRALVFATLATLGLRAQVQTANVAIYAAPPGLTPSTQYSVQVLVDGQWVDSFVNFDTARTSGNGSSDEPGKTFSWTTFETTSPIAIRVRRLDGGFNSVVLRPSRYGISATKIGADTAEFTIQPGQKVSVEFDTEIKNPAYTGAPYGIPIIKDAMMVFADPRKLTSDIAGIDPNDILNVTPGTYQTILPVTGGAGLSAGKSTLNDAGGKKVVVFGPGVYDIGYWQVPNNVEQIHLEGGAVVYGAIDVLPQGRTPFYDRATIQQVYQNGWFQETLRTSFKLTGHGILSGAKLPWHLEKDFTYSSNDDWWANVKLVQLAVANVTVRDLTLADSGYWAMTWINDDDERTHGTLDNFKMVAAWTYNNDGLPVPSGATSSITNAFIHADDDAFKIYNSGATIDNCVVWQSNNGAPFQFGWFPKTVGNVIIGDVDVIHFENWYGVNQSNRAVFNYANTGGAGTIGNISFTNINVEGKILRLFAFNTVGSAQIIRDITFTNLSVPGGMGAGQLGAPGRNYFIGNITNFSFDAFNFGGQIVTGADQAQFDFANGAGAGFTFTNSGLPIASAGPDRAITLPTSSVTLNGSGIDVGGSISAYAWTQVSGPALATLSGANASSLTAANLVVGTYDFRLTVTDNDGNTASDDVLVTVAPQPPPTAPVTNAGPDKAITLPTSSVTLNGSAIDVNNDIALYSWTQVSGPTTATLTNAATASLTASNLAVGTYVFRLTVTDATNLSSSDTASVTVAPEPPPQPPVANAGADKAIVLPVSSVTLAGSATDVDGTIVSIAWTQISGPSVATLAGAATLSLTASDLVVGTYVFRLTVIDSQGLTASDEAGVTVYPVGTVLGSSILWTRAAGNSNLAVAGNWEGGVVPGALDIAVLRAPTVTDNNYNVNAATLRWGAIYVTTAQTGFWNFQATVSGGQTAGTLIFTGRDVAGYPRAFVVNVSNQGGGLRSNVTLDGGGAFIIVHNSGSALEIDGRFRETNGSASLIVDGGGRPGVGQARVTIRGNNTPEQVYGLTGNIVVRNGANLRVEDGFDLSTVGGTITVDSTSRWNLGSAVTYKVAALTIAGRAIAPGSYNQPAFVALGLGAYVENTGGAIVVTGVAPRVVTPPTAVDGVFGGSATFTVAAEGTAPLSYQWRKDGTPIAGATGASLKLSPLVLSDAGAYDVVVTNVVGSATSAAATLTVAPAPATISLGNLAQTYDGTPKSASVATVPDGIAVTLTYNGDPALPVNAGAYAIVATIADPNYVGSASGTLVVAKAPAMIALANLAQTYDGAARTVTAITTPAGLAVQLAYDGSAAAPINAGAYAIAATIADPNYTGAAFGTLVVAKAPATVALDDLHQIYDGAPKPVTATTTPPGLTVTLTYDGGATPPTAPGAYAVVGTIEDPNYTGSVTDTLVISTAVVVRHAPSFNAGLDGSIQVLLPESATLNGNAWISGDLLVPGTPTVHLNGHPAYAGTLDGTGDATPSNFAVTLNGGAVLRHVVRRTDAVALPTIGAPPAPTGTRDVSLNSASADPGDFATIRNLTLNGNAGARTLPAGTYGALTANGNSSLILGVDGATSPAVYNLQNLTLNGNSTLQIVGPVIVNLANGISVNGSLGDTGHPEWLTLNIASGGVTLNGNVTVSGSVTAPNGAVTLNGNSTLHGRVTADRLTLNGNSLLDTTP